MVRGEIPFNETKNTALSQFRSAPNLSTNLPRDVSRVKPWAHFHKTESKDCWCPRTETDCFQNYCCLYSFSLTTPFSLLQRMGFFWQGGSKGGDGNRAMTSALAKIYIVNSIRTLSMNQHFFVYISSVLFFQLLSLKTYFCTHLIYTCII